MNVGIADVVIAEVELIWRSAEVALFEDEYLQLLCEEHPHSDVKLAAGKEQRLLHVFLDNEGTGSDGEVGRGFSDSKGFLEDWVCGDFGALSKRQRSDALDVSIHESFQLKKSIEHMHSISLNKINSTLL